MGAKLSTMIIIVDQGMELNLTIHTYYTSTHRFPVIILYIPTTERRAVVVIEVVPPIWYYNYYLLECAMERWLTTGQIIRDIDSIIRLVSVRSIIYIR